VNQPAPLRLDAWMALCNAAYYARPDPLAGNFTTAPEVSQMFGELLGGWLADGWLRAGAPACRLVELGPGRGTLIADIWRVLGRLPDAPARITTHLVETSPSLSAMQQAALAGRMAQWHQRLEDVPEDAPLLLLANEFFDALPIRQRVGGQELFVAETADGFAPLWQPAPGPDAEWSEASAAIAGQIGARLARHGGAALLIDYGHAGVAPGDSLQALAHGQPISPWGPPGSADLTAHVDFAALAAAATAAGARAHGPVPQGALLAALGIEARATRLAAGKPPAQAAQVQAALVRLTTPTQMGVLFKALALTGKGWPVPAGFGMVAA
jgi:NADH dehydrogenase [ubiquinone] 1 alpha subcomplex assembly factor 7